MATQKETNVVTLAIIDAHNNGNGHAIKAEEISAVGGSKEHLERLNNLEDNVHKAYKDTFLAGMRGQEKDYGEFMGNAKKAWRALASFVQPTSQPKLRIADMDVEFTLGDIKKHLNVEGKGSTYGITGQKAFRKLIETYLGVLIAKQVILDEEETKAVRSYQTALKRIDKTNDELDKLKGQKADYGKLVASLTGDAKTAIEKLVDDIQAQIDKLEEKLTKAEQQKKDNKTAYMAAKAKLNKPIKVNKTVKETKTETKKADAA